MITIYNVKKSKIGEIPKFLMELRGLSTDDKPTSWENGIIENGSAFIEIDTGDIYLYDEDNSEWNNITSTTPAETNDEENNEEEQNVGE